MNKTTTYNDLLKYAYNESGLTDGDRIQRAIDGDPLIQGEYNELIQVISQLDVTVPPVSEKCIDNILQFARQ